MAASISASGDYQKLSHDQLAVEVHQQIQTLIADLPAPQWQQVIVEKRATFACVAGLHRPSHETAHPHLHIAGDYTAGAYPATLEGAVRSGIACAQLVLARH
jgi:uncharacterized protein with NAD-binding domain and iron-sulfur cluster